MKVALLGSGRGSNAEAILGAWKAGALGTVEPVLLLSDRKTAPFLDLGGRYGLPAEAIPAAKGSGARLGPEVEQAYVERLQQARVELVVLVGFMRILVGALLEHYPEAIVNLHPSLLPAFRGLNAIRRAHAYGVRLTGCTVHYVTRELDGGPILAQEAVAIDPGDSLATVEARVHKAEHRLMPRILREIAEGQHPFPASVVTSDPLDQDALG